ncbi:MAG: hypothetical protein ACRC33_00720, partial [Gemmataceae bacterium]
GAPVAATPPAPPPATPGPISATPVTPAETPKPAATPIVVGPSAGMPAPPGPPAVERYRLHAVAAVQGESWMSFSRKFYGDARCADALREFNRNYGFAAPRLRQDGVIIPGDTVHIPPLALLLERHRSLIRDDAVTPTDSTPMTRPLN